MALVSEYLDYPLMIDGTSPRAIPMVRLAHYIAEYAKLLGSAEHVRFSHVQDGSLEIHAHAPIDCVPLISPRVRTARAADVDASAFAAWRRLNEMLAEDGWTAKLPLPRDGEVIIFPGCSKSSKALRVITQATTINGRLIRMEGAGDMVHIGLDIDGDLTARITVPAKLASDLASHWHKYVSITGEGRWKRDENGRWLLDRLSAKSFEPLDDAPLANVLGKLREFVAPGTGKDIIAAVDELRRA